MNEVIIFTSTDSELLANQINEYLRQDGLQEFKLHYSTHLSANKMDIHHHVLIEYTYVEK